jgi:hypothetical protein
MSFSDLPDHWLYSRFYPEAGACVFARAAPEMSVLRVSKCFFFLSEV